MRSCLNEITILRSDSAGDEKHRCYLVFFCLFDKPSVGNLFASVRANCRLFHSAPHFWAVDELIHYTLLNVVSWFLMGTPHTSTCAADWRSYTMPTLHTPLISSPEEDLGIPPKSPHRTMGNFIMQIFPSSRSHIYLFNHFKWCPHFVFCCNRISQNRQRRYCRRTDSVKSYTFGSLNMSWKVSSELVGRTC